LRPVGSNTYWLGQPVTGTGVPPTTGKLWSRQRNTSSLWDPVTADGTLATTQIGGVEVLVERRVGEVGAMDRAEIGKASGRRTREHADETLVLEQLARVGDARAAGAGSGHRRVERARTDRGVKAVARASETSEPLDDMRLPPGDVPRDLLEDCHGSLAAAIVDRLGDVPALTRWIEPVDEIRGQEVAEIRNDPVVGGLDRLVGPQPVDAAADDRGLCADSPGELLEWSRDGRVVTVAGPVDAGKQLPEAIGVVAVVAVVEVSHRSPPG